MVVPKHSPKRLHAARLLILYVFLALATAGCRPAAVPASAADSEPHAPPTSSPVATDTPAPTAVPEPEKSTPSAPAVTQALDIDAPRRFTYAVVNRFPHDPAAFTQGLIYADGIFYEGTGLYGESTLRKVDPETGTVLIGARLPDQYFGEGVTLFEDKIYLLTWKSQTGFVVDADSFDLLDTFTYPTEGWGLTHDGERLIMSDGSNVLTYLDPDTLAPIDTIQVFDDETPILALNELEYIDGQIYANVWQTNDIAIIDPESGVVTGWIDLTGLLSFDDLAQPVDVLNGIAYDAATERLFVTGKLWPTLFEITLVEIQE